MTSSMTRPAPASASWRALGCDVRILVTDASALVRARAMLVADLDALDRAASRFRPDSEVCLLAAGDGRPVPISPVLADAVATALVGAELSGGDLDPTLGAQLAALGYDRTFTDLVPAGQATTPPGDAPHASAGPVSGLDVRPPRSWRDVHLDAVAGMLGVPPGTVLDLGATAKGRCADLAAARIAEELGCGVLVSLGGDIAVAGPAPEGCWVVRVQDVTGDPDEPATGPTCLVGLASGGLATSSTAARRWRHGGSVLHHILDPRSGRPAADVWRTVSVAAPTCTLANIASTTAVIRGRAAVPWLRGLDLAARLVAQSPAGSDPAVDPEVVLMGGWPKEVQ